jgi:SAM-dependent methyltransferase
MPLIRLMRHIRARLQPRLRPLSIQLRWRLLGRKLDRNQWQHQPAEIDQRYERMMTLGWDEIATDYPEYFARLKASVAHTRGRVLELGCGTGNMTRWIAARDEVTSVVAIDGFERAVQKLRGFALPKVDARCSPLTELAFAAEERFDTLVMCELLEHLYPDEERALWQAVRPHMAAGAGYVISVPVGWLEDPHHVRAFSRGGLSRHLKRRYGSPEGRDESSGYSQVVWGKLRDAGDGSRQSAIGNRKDRNANR